MNGAPGSSSDVLEAESDRMKYAKVCVKRIGPIRPVTPLMLAIEAICGVRSCIVHVVSELTLKNSQIVMVRQGINP